jgi:enediyne biosynthesis protein E4
MTSVGEGRHGAHRAALLTCMILASTIGACRRDAAPAWREESGLRWRALEVTRAAARSSVGFTKMESSKTGVRFQNNASEKILLGNRTLAQGGGVSLGDVDGDGRPDIFLARTEGCSALYRNEGNWKFEDITTRARVGACDRHSSGSAMADVDGDGDLDLVLLATTGPNAIFLNDGKARFTERRDLGLDTIGRGATTVTMADVAGDGRLAMFIANYKPYNVDDTIPPQRRAFNQMVRETGAKQFEIQPEHRKDYKLVMRPDMGGMRMTQRAEPDEYYVNDGAGRFTRVPMTSGRFRDATGAPITEEFESFGLSAKFVDLNGDGAPDLYVANDFEDTDQLWYNDGRGTFQLAPWTAQRQMSHSAMGVDVADVNGDGRPDLFETDMMANDPKRLKTQTPTHTSLPKKVGESELALQFQRNALFINRGDGTFSEISSAAGVQASGWSWGTTFMDVDLDGWQDILVANGHLWDIMDADVYEGLQNRLTDVPWQRLRWEFPTLKLKNVAFRNRGDLTFEDASAAWRFGIEEDISHGLASADLDGDGDLDVVVNRLGDPALLLRNDATAARVSVRLVGDAPNTRAVGAKVSLHNGATPLQVHEVVVGGLYLSHSDYTLSFAMGASDSARLVIEWRDGRRTEIPRVRKNREYEVLQQNASPGSAAVAAASPRMLMFNDVSAQLGGHVHVEDQFDDWDRQFLLPNALSQLGPGLAWYDLDRDGADELLVGTGKGGRVNVFQNVRGALVPQAARGPVANADLTSVLGMTDRGVTQVLAGAATWQFRVESEMAAQPAAVSFAVQRGVLAEAPRGVVGSHQSSTGPLALGDYDGDGALDLFVGSRAMPLRYPLPASSGLFRNVNGAFVIDTANLAVLRDIGMVSSAMFADINGDARADLVLTRDWGSIVLLLNDGRGRLLRAPDSWRLGDWTSQWNGIAAGDLDGDGRLDLVATSWGRNTGMQVDSSRPLVMTYGAFGAGGEVEMLLGQPDARVRGLSPLNSYPRVRMAVAGVVGRVANFTAYADASVETVLGAAMSSAQRLSIRTLDHVALMNRGDHFDGVPLPAEAQWAPAFGAGIADFDGDGADDVFLSQNFFPTMISIPRYDQGRSLLLRGNGAGALEPVDGGTSGLTVYGDQRGAAYSDFNADGRLDLAVTQNGGPTRLFQNALAKPGLRVRLRGSERNPDGVGAQVRVVYDDGTMGPVREVQAGAGYWSQNSAVQVLGLRRTPSAVWVRWPGGEEQRVPVTPGSLDVVATRR